MARHFDYVKRVIERLTTAKMILNPEKCYFGKKAVYLLGYCVSKKGKSLDPREVTNISEWSLSQTCTFDSTTIVDSDNELEGSSNDEELPKSRWYIDDMDISKMLFDYRRSVITISKIIYDSQCGVPLLEMGMIKLLELSVKEGISIYEKKIIKDIACMLNFLPKREVNVTKLGEPELWSRYCNPLLTSMLSENENNVILRWTNKAADNYSSKWSDAIISAMNEEVCLGYGECKL
ncbi:hypothetical protein CU097_015167, partial [Rhizopus azygosporus]